MKSIFVIVLATLLGLLVSCVGKAVEKPTSPREKINARNIDSIQICRTADSIYVWKTLGQGDEIAFAKTWNTSKSKGICKMWGSYQFRVWFRDGSERRFCISEKTIRANNDRCFEIADSTYANRLWTKINQ